jgi:hypothetical protein
MPTYPLRIAPEEVLRLVRAETDEAGGQPELYLGAWQDYVIEEDYDRASYGLDDDNRYDLVTAQAVLNIEPRLEQNYWVLSVVARREVGPQIIEDENALLGAPLTLERFESDFLATDGVAVGIRLDARTPQAKQHFDRWWAELSRRHPRESPPARPARAAARTEGEPAERIPAMADVRPAANPWTYRTREAVGVFADPDALEAAVNALETSGFDRASISVLGADAKVKQRIGRLYRSVAEIEDDPRAPRAAHVSSASRVEGEAAAVAVPFYIGGLAGAAAVVASGGVLAAAIAGTILGCATGAGLGAVLAHAVARHHAKRVEEQLAQGGFVLWVGVPSADAERRARAALEQAGARDIHVHELKRQWGPGDRPLSEAWVDPFLDHDPAA